MAIIARHRQIVKHSLASRVEGLMTTRVVVFLQNASMLGPAYCGRRMLRQLRGGLIEEVAM